MTEQLNAQLKAQQEHDESKYKEMEAQRREVEAQRRELEAKLEAQRQEMENRIEAQREEVERLRDEKLEVQRQEMEALRQEMERLRDVAKPQRASNTIDDESLDALQSRLQELHAAQLLSEEELGVIEDTIADCIDVLPTAMSTDLTVDKVVKMINLSSKMKSDTSFARQLKRRALK